MQHLDFYDVSSVKFKDPLELSKSVSKEHWKLKTRIVWSNKLSR